MLVRQRGGGRHRRGAASAATAPHDGKPAVVLGIQKQPGANTLELTGASTRTLAEIQATLPAGMLIESHIFRQADFIRIAIDNLVAALRDGAMLVIVIVFAFLLSAARDPDHPARHPALAGDRHARP